MKYIFLFITFRGQKRVSPSKLKWKVQEHQQHAVSVPFLGNPSLVPSLVFLPTLSILNFPFSFLPKLYWYVLVRCTHLFSGKKYDEGLSLGQSNMMFGMNSKVGLKSERAGVFLHCQRKVPKSFLKLLHPVHGNDKMLIWLNILQVKKHHNYVTWITYIIQKKQKHDSYFLVLILEFYR